MKAKQLQEKALSFKLLLLGVVAALGVLPFVVLLNYAHPALDDFGYAVLYRTAGFVDGQRQLYLTLTGRYTSSALLTIANPLSYGCLPGQPLAGGILLVAWWAALTVLVHELLRSLVRWGAAAFVGLLLLALSLAQLPSPAEGIYWLSGAYTYSVPTTLTLLLLAVLVRQLRASGRARTGWGIVAGVLVVVIMGGNEINGLILLTGLAATALVARLGIQAWVLVAVAAAGALVAWGAPGNFVRMHTINHSLSYLSAIKYAVVAAGYCLLNWLGNGILPVAGLLLAGWAHHQVQTRQQASALLLPLTKLTRRPVFLTALLLALLILSFIPSYWATGITMPRRARNAVYELFVIGWLLVVYSWLSWCWQRYTLPAQWPTVVIVALLGWLGLALLTDHNVTLQRDQMGVGSTTLVQAYRDWVTGSAAAYDQQQRARYTLLQTSKPSPTPLRLTPLRVMPVTLFYYDISANYHLWGNVAYAQFFGWPGVYVSETDDTE